MKIFIGQERTAEVLLNFNTTLHQGEFSTETNNTATSCSGISQEFRSSKQSGPPQLRDGRLALPFASC